MKSIIKCLLITLNITFATLIANAQSCPDSNHPHAIDLGLPSGTKWACCNVGATTPEEQGYYYSWGETKEKDQYDWTTYIHCDGSMDTCHDLGSDIAGTEYDVAHVQWGGSWVMPSKDQIQELIDNCSYVWTSMNDRMGGFFTGSNGSTIFLPEVWIREDCIGESKNSSSNIVADPMPESGSYWSSTPNQTYSWSANYLIIYNNGVNSGSGALRRDGLTVRPVISGNRTNKIIHPNTSNDAASLPLYDLSGRRLTREPEKGVYIKAGKKVVIK